MSNLKSTIDGLATQFASSIVQALRGASIEELLSLSGGGGGGGGAERGRPVRVRTETSGAAAPAASAPAAAPRGRRGRGGRLGRRSPDEIGKVIESIVALLEKHPDGLRSEQIRESLNLEAKELPRPLADGISSGLLTKTGQKRATTYFAGSGDGGKRRGGRRAARGKRG